MTRWRKAGGSGGGNSDCVEVALGGSRAAVRDSKDPAGPVLGFGTTAWRGLLGWCGSRPA
ncbi:DUF397 domain-containing protein [Actinophytocola sp.]|uniref:DUF397 domain-containing protein n=1 Tax=Actinophytocola sp. TaxID=1872138 RepID=UPI002D7F2137|nr:DUF397 domain-containing protein [Actinophytocola sp.]HET9138796.1 DUF397 domain-containing protein [Actinophytocola sp.]